jgi:23S rRNA (cytosine1962-C5)-methyltransferase
VIPCVLHEDEHLLVVNKPAGWNTHAPSPFAGEGIYDWLKHREPRWANLAIIHRLDKETSGVLVFGKTALANRSLTEQFTERSVRKTYLFLTDRAVPKREFTVKSKILRIGERYASGAHGEPAETRFGVPASAGPARQNRLKAELQTVEATPLTGRTHQIRVHAADRFPVLGDTLYGGTPWARVCLHAAAITLRHPATGEEVAYSAPADFDTDARAALRSAIIESEATEAYRLVHGASDGWPEWYVDRIGSFLLSQSEAALTAAQHEEMGRLAISTGCGGAYHKILTRHVRRTTAAEAAPQLVLGPAAPARFTVRENGAKFELSFSEGYSVGLFLDQRDNRRRLLTGHVATDFPLFVGQASSLSPVAPRTSVGSDGDRLEACPAVLNAFAYTCGFSVCAALAGARTTSLDLSRKYLDWGKRNFALNGLDPAAHDFIYGDVFDWLRRLAKKGRAFDAILLDPPTFSQSKERGVFRVEKDYGRLVAAALPLVKVNGLLFASTNAAGWPPEEFLRSVEGSIRAARRKIGRRHYVPQPPDFRISRAEPAYLKTVWLRIE